jgi:hypothetical protein
MKMKIDGSSSLGLARQIRAAGILIYISEDDDPGRASVPLEGVLVRQTGGWTEGQAFDFGASAGYILELVITVNITAFAISDFVLEVPWGDALRSLEDPRSIDGTSVYRFGGTNSLEFHRDQVINHYADPQRILARGSSVAGLLLAVGSEPIPRKFPHGATIPAFVAIIDQFGRKYRSPVALYSYRPPQRRQVASKRGPLLARRDPVPR